jgi:hypothetical protein
MRFHAGMALITAALLVVAADWAYLARAEDFRIDNKVYSGSQKEPTSESTTIFRGGVVYDFMKTPPETVTFDKAASKFVLLNAKDQLRSELSTDDVRTLSDGLQARAAKNKDPMLKFLARPTFDERMDESAGELNLTSPPLSYRLTLLPETDPTVLEQYREFCDWYARLNSVLVPGAWPPAGRLTVNAALAHHHALASQVVITVTAGKGLSKQKSIIRTEHKLVRPLAPEDIERVDQVRKQLGSFKLVPFEKYRKSGPQ